MDVLGHYPVAGPMTCDVSRMTWLSCDFIMPCTESRHPVPDGVCSTAFPSGDGALFLESFIFSYCKHRDDVTYQALFFICPNDTLPEGLWVVNMHFSKLIFFTFLSCSLLLFSFFIEPKAIQKATYGATRHCCILILEGRFNLFWSFLWFFSRHSNWFNEV